MKYLCVIHDMGDIWKITDTKEEEDSFRVDENLYLEVSEESMLKIKELMLENELSYPKETQFKLDILIKNKLDSLDIAKYRAKNKIKNTVKMSFSELDQYSVLKYMMLNTELSDKGFYLHADNVDIKISEIEELNNLSLLKKAKELKETIKYLEGKVGDYSRVEALKKKIDLCRSVEQINEKLDSAELSY